MRLLDMNRRLRVAKVGSIALFAVAAVISIPVYGWAMQLPFLLAAIAFGAVQMRIERLRRPELALAGVWLFAQLAIVLAISLDTGPRIYAIPILIFPMLMAAASFPRRVVAAGAAISVALMLATGFWLMAGTVAALPPVLIIPVAALLEVTLLASGTVEADEAARHSAVLDQLTGLLNRAALQARAAELTHHLGRPDAPQVAVILADLDRFKMVNDAHGHAVGDMVLLEVARRLKRTVGQSGSLYRYGGEEFIVLLEGEALAGAAALAERMRAAVSLDPVAELAVTLSLGVAGSSTLALDCATLLADADQALYRAKAGGRDRVCLADPDDARAAPTPSHGASDPDAVVLVDRRLRPAETAVLSSVADGEVESDGSSVCRQRRAGWKHWTAAEREHMLDIVARVTKIGKVADPIALAALLGAGPWLGWTPLVPVIVSIAVMQLVHLLVLPRVRRTEFVALGGVFLAQIGGGLYIVLAHHPLVGLPLLTILIFAAAAAAPAPAAAAQTVIAAAVMATAALLAGASEILENPSILALPLALLGAVALFGYAIGQSTVAHRTVVTVDALTGSLSRAALGSRVAELSHRGAAVGEPVAMLIADLDHFKMINDEHGHARGDLVLAEVAERLRAGVRAFDSVYRIGGEEFVSLLVGLDQHEAVAVAERISSAIREQPVAGLPVTVSIGVASCTPDVRFDYEQMFAEADAALLAAKAEGRDRVLTTPPMRHAVAA